MLRWTPSGAVSEPATVQVRMAPRFPGSVRAGAPSPGRALSIIEVNQNILWFVRDRVGPRIPAVTSAVLSAVVEPQMVAEAVSGWRRAGLQRLVWHLGESEADTVLLPLVDEVVCVVRSAGAAHASALTATDGRWCAVVPLGRDVCDQLPEIVQSLIAMGPARVVLQWPFPGAEVLAPPAQQIAPVVREAVLALEQAAVDVGVKGLPPCALSPTSLVGPWAGRVSRTGNRWYVDAEHQLDEALLFFPDITRFAKPDSCRFCAVGHCCDGVPQPWLAQGLAGVLNPMHTG